jgi:hypothetical protein
MAKQREKKIDKKDDSATDLDAVLPVGFTKNQLAFLDALRDCLGVISKSANQCGLHRNNHSNWMKTNPLYKEEYEGILEDSIDYVEDKLYENITENDTACIIFYLKTKAKHRGFVERTELDVTAGKIITVNAPE